MSMDSQRIVRIARCPGDRARVPQQPAAARMDGHRIVRITCCNRDKVRRPNHAAAAQ
jgi:hypothetical protein